MNNEDRRRTPDEFLRAVQAEEAAARTGHLKIFLGYASGVGKTVRMLDEARRRRERGQDIVMGAIQPNAPAEAQELLKRLEVVPLKQVGPDSAIDVEALLRRRPPSASSTVLPTTIRRACATRRDGRMYDCSSIRVSR